MRVKPTTAARDLQPDAGFNSHLAHPAAMTSIARLTCTLLTPLCLLPAWAGTLEGATWKPGQCGPTPTPPALAVRNVDAYNATVALVNTYRKQSRAHTDCLVREANADIQAITQAATAAQQAEREADARLLAELKAAGDKLPK